jgi:hypothetical protein
MKLLEKKQKKNEEKTWKIDFFFKSKKIDRETRH